MYIFYLLIHSVANYRQHSLMFLLSSLINSPDDNKFKNKGNTKRGASPRLKI